MRLHGRAWLAGVVLGLAACAVAPLPRDVSALDLVPAPVDDAAAFRRPAVQAALDRLTFSLETPGNAATLLVNGASVARRIEDMQGAEVVLVKTFQFGDDETGRRMAALLIERARAGAYVIVQYEPIINIEGWRGLREMLHYASPEQPLGERRIIHALRQAGITVVATNPLNSPEALVYHDHEKYWITGHRDAAGRLVLRAILGGTSLSSAYAFGGTPRVDRITGDRGWRDTDVELCGPVVNQIAERYFELVEFHTGRPLPPEVRLRYNPPQAPCGDARVRFVWNHPAAGNVRAVENAYRVLADATPPGGVVRIETAYFAPRNGLLDSLIAALRRGTRLTLVTNSPQSNNHVSTSLAGRSVLTRLLRIDPRLALLERVPRPDIGEVTLHSKVASFGTRGPAIVGSANFDGEAEDHCTESIAIIDDPEFRRDFDAMFVRDIAADRVNRVTLPDLLSRPAWQRARGWLLYHLAGSWL